MDMAVPKTSAAGQVTKVQAGKGNLTLGAELVCALVCWPGRNRATQRVHSLQSSRCRGL